VQIENSFSVAAPAERVFAFLLDVHSVVGCVPGAELGEVVDPQTFRGRVRVRVGAVSITYDGSAHVVARDDAARTAILEAAGRETSGSGSARATVSLSVAEQDGGSAVRVLTDLGVVGRAAQFGRGMIEEVSRGLVAQTGERIRARLEAPEAPLAEPPAADQPAEQRAKVLPITIMSEEPEEPAGVLGRMRPLVPIGAAAALAVLVLLLRSRRR